MYIICEYDKFFDYFFMKVKFKKLFYVYYFYKDKKWIF